MTFPPGAAELAEGGARVIDRDLRDVLADQGPDDGSGRAGAERLPDEVAAVVMRPREGDEQFTALQPARVRADTVERAIRSVQDAVHESRGSR